MADRHGQQTVTYHRRLDRTPEKHFERLPESEKKLISAVRNALEGCKKKVEALKDDLAEKDKTIATERRLREEAEDHLKAYVDPYLSPLVNSELRMRLPRAGKLDPFQDRNTDMASEGVGAAENVIVPNQESQSWAHISSTDDRMKKKSVRCSLNFSSSKSQNECFDCGDGDVEEESSTDEELSPFQKPGHGQRKKASDQKTRSAPPDMSRFPAVWGSGYPATPYFLSLQRPTSCPSHYDLTPWSSASSLGLFPSLPANLQNLQHSASLGKPFSGQPARGENPQPSSETKNDKSSSELRPAADTETHDNARHKLLQASHDASKPPVLQSPNPREACCQELHSESTDSLSSRYGLPLPPAGPDRYGFPLPPAGRDRGTGMWPDLFPIPSSSFAVGPAGARTDVCGLQTSHLRDEIGCLQEQNKQLKERLELKCQELEVLRLHNSLSSSSDGTLDTSAVSRLADLMAEVKVAHERQEKVMQARTCPADDDRDKLMLELDKALVTDRRVAHTATLDDSSSHSDESDTEFSLRKKKGDGQLTSCSHSSNKDKRALEYSDGPGGISSGTAVFKKLESRYQREREIYLEEMQVLMDQRDQALAEVCFLKQQQQVQRLHASPQREQMLLVKIAALQHERDSAYELVRRLRDEQLDYGLLSSLHKALFADSKVSDPSTTLSSEKMFHTKDKDSSENDKDCDNKDKDCDDKDKDCDDKDKDCDDTERDEVRASEIKDNQLLEQLRQADREKALLHDKCRELERMHRREKEERNKLERLTGVLQKKLLTLAKSSKLVEQE